jgi:hypothetical protein
MASWEGQAGGGPLAAALSVHWRLQVRNVRVRGKVQIPVFLVTISFYPLDGLVCNNLRWLVTNVGSRSDRLLEFGGEEVGPVALGEGRDAGGQVAVLGQELAQEGAARFRAVTGVKAKPCRVAGMANDAIGDAELAAGQRGSRRQARGVGAVITVEPDAPFRKLVEIWGDGSLVAVGPVWSGRRLSTST